MAFYGERFRRPDEEDIWEELKQMLLNSPSEQEIALKKQKDQAWIDSILEKITDPYLTGPKPEGEDLLNTSKSVNNIISSSQTNLNPSPPPIQKTMSQNEWLEELKRKRKKLGWW